LDAGVVSPSGRYASNSSVPAAFQSRLRGDGPRREFLLAEGNGSADVTLTQRDLRELQLAKAAIAAGFRRMLEFGGLKVSQVEHLYLAGAFGSHLDPRASVRIGLLPGLPVERVVPIGNAAGSGAKMAVFSRAMRQVAADIAAKTRYIELSSDARFNELFVEEMAYPEGAGS
ncbi:MAG: ASKHA domain-containing protein, partial [Chloroflexota bacterium]|nr:ASKHA domain-containing protein [Chloroflexota bacterium]